MKKTLIILFLFYSLILRATNYYIATAANGGDNAKTGLIGQPWLTLAYACAHTTAGDVINVGVGTFTETVSCDLPMGVSIVGVGVTSHIISTYAPSSSLYGSITLSSTTAGTDGNQSISFIELDGSTLSGKKAIVVYKRSNVLIHDCTIVDFEGSGVSFKSNAAETGNQLYNNIITNCADRNYTHGQGLIELSYQNGLLIHDNILTQNSRAALHNGNIIDAVAGNCEALKYYNNKSYKPADEGGGWNFHIENWDCLGGFEIYDNEFYGGTALDCGGVFSIKGSHAYSWYIHDNLFELTAQYPTFTDFKIGIDIEGNAEYMIIAYNHFLNLPMGIEMTVEQDNRIQENINIYYNVFENIGWGSSSFGFAICMISSKATSIRRYINIYNNVISSGVSPEGSSTAAVMISATGSNSNINIENNIMQNFVAYGVITFWDGAGTIDLINIKNNILYNNVSANDFYYKDGQVVTNLINTGNIKLDPEFVSNTDFNLKVSSPAINAGLNVGLTRDYVENSVPFNSLVDIGAFEYEYTEKFMKYGGKLNLRMKYR
jgi:hypothetical protein